MNNALVAEPAKKLANKFAAQIAKGEFVDVSPAGVNQWARGLNFFDLKTLRDALFAASVANPSYVECHYGKLNGSELIGWFCTNRPASRWDRVAAFRRVCNGNA